MQRIVVIASVWFWACHCQQLWMWNYNTSMHHYCSIVHWITDVECFFMYHHFKVFFIIILSPMHHIQSSFGREGGIIAIVIIIICGCQLKRRICKWQKLCGFLFPTILGTLAIRCLLCACLILCWRLQLAHLAGENTWTAVMDSETNTLGFQSKKPCLC